MKALCLSMEEIYSAKGLKVGLFQDTKFLRCARCDNRMGIVSSLGNNISEVTHSLENLKSGITKNHINAELGLRSQVSGSVKDLEMKALIDRKLYRFMGDAAAYAYLSTEQAIHDAELNEAELSSVRTGLILGSCGASS